MFRHKSIHNILKISAFILLFLGCDHKKDLQSIEIKDLIERDGTVSNKIINLAHQMNISFKDPASSQPLASTGIVLENKSAEEFTALIQGRHPAYPHFSLRQAGKERWQMSTNSTGVSSSDQIRFYPTTEQTSQLLHTILAPAQDNTKDDCNLGMGIEQLPNQHNYEHVLLLGSTYQNFEQRLVQLKKTLQLAEQAPGFDPKKVTIFLISGIRALRPDELQLLSQLESQYQSAEEGSKEYIVLQKIIRAKETKNEYEMHDAQLADFALTISPDYVYDFANEKNIAEGQVRSSTESTIDQYIKDQIVKDPENWNQKNLLLISTHIFGLYQKLITERVLRSGSLMHKNLPYVGSVQVSSCALESNESDHFDLSQKLAIATDNLSRLFYEIVSYKKAFGEYPQ